MRSHGVRGRARAHLEYEPPEEPLHRAQDPPRVPVQLGVDRAGVGHVGAMSVFACLLKIGSAQQDAVSASSMAL